MSTLVTIINNQTHEDMYEYATTHKGDTAAMQHALTYLVHEFGLPKQAKPINKYHESTNYYMFKDYTIKCRRIGEVTVVYDASTAVD